MDPPVTTLSLFQIEQELKARPLPNVFKAEGRISDSWFMR